MNKFNKLYENFINENEEIKALIIQKKSIQDKIRNSTSKYPEENKIDHEKIKIIDKKVNLAKEKENIENTSKRLQDQIDRLQKKKGIDTKSSSEEDKI